MLSTLNSLLLLVPIAAPVGLLQASKTEPRPALVAALGLATESSLRLSGDLGNELERTPFALEFDAHGRFSADYTSAPLKDSSFDGESGRGRDAAGYTHELSGWELDTVLLTHGLVCGNWVGEAAPWEAQVVGTKAGLHELRVNASERHFEAHVWVDAETWLPERATYSTFGKETAYEFSDWRAAPEGSFPGRVSVATNGMSISEFRFERLEALVPTPEYSLEDEPPDDFSFDRDAPRALEVRVLKSGHQFVRASLDGSEPGWFLFDTGAPGVALDHGLARELGLKLVLDDLTATGAGGHARLRLWRAHELVVGPLTWHAPLVGSMDLQPLGRRFGLELAGILGADVFSAAVWTVDVTAGEIEVHPAGEFDPEGANWLPTRRNEGHLLVPGSFEDHAGWFTFDTGAGGAGVSFHGPTVERFDLLRGRKTVAGKVFGTGGLASTRQGRIESFTLAGMTSENLVATFPGAMGTWNDPYIDGLIGIWFMRPHLVVLDYPGNRLGFIER